MFCSVGPCSAWVLASPQDPLKPCGSQSPLPFMRSTLVMVVILLCPDLRSWGTRRAARNNPPTQGTGLGG